jgi:hypothetical protein
VQSISERKCLALIVNYLFYNSAGSTAGFIEEKGRTCGWEPHWATKRGRRDLIRK